MSREYSSGSIKLLFSSPISSLQIILGKYFSMLIYGLIMMGSVLVLVVVAFFSIKDFDLSLVLSGWLGLYLLMATYAAIGLFMSTLTSYQIIAALGTLTFISFLNFIGSLWQHIEGVREVMYWFLLKGRADESIRGLICSEDILFYSRFGNVPRVLGAETAICSSELFHERESGQIRGIGSLCCPTRVCLHDSSIEVFLRCYG